MALESYAGWFQNHSLVLLGHADVGNCVIDALKHFFAMEEMGNLLEFFLPGLVFLLEVRFAERQKVFEV